MNTPATADIKDQAAISLIAADAQFFHKLVLSATTRSYRSIASLALLPNLSAFLVDSAEYLRRRRPSLAAVLRPDEDLLLASRLRMKLLDNDDRTSLNDALTKAERLARINSSWFTGGHRGILGPLKRLFQDDLGLFFFEGELMSTTHVAFLNMGLNETALAASSLSLANLGPYLYNVSKNGGRYLSAIMRELNIPPPLVDNGSNSNAPSTGRDDVKSSHFYKRMGDRMAPGRIDICILLTSILSQVNTARLVVPRIAGANRMAILKAQLIATIHCISSLQKLIDHHKRNAFFRTNAESGLKTVLRAPIVRNARDYDSLRNVLVHYAAHKNAATNLTPTAVDFGVVKAHARGKTIPDMLAITSSALDHLASNLEKLLFERRLRSRFSLDS